MVELGDKCVVPEDCPGPSSGDCPPGKEYQECGTACPLNCTNKDELLICTKQCVQGVYSYMFIIQHMLYFHLLCADMLDNVRMVDAIISNML